MRSSNSARAAFFIVFCAAAGVGVSAGCSANDTVAGPSDAAADGSDDSAPDGCSTGGSVPATCVPDSSVKDSAAQDSAVVETGPTCLPTAAACNQPSDCCGGKCTLTFGGFLRCTL
jgi:hypothetical protein